ncbi:phage head closure protein [Atrimonas thermophila]|uniref:phage head closure protein n=1 Tax=Atrimonas thermophila TaxID=3064161 RepID=UPI00399CD88B
MRIGELRHRVTIQRLNRVPDGMGGYEEQWQDVVSLWAKVEPLKGRERFVAQQAQSEVTHRITTRYYSGIEPQMRVVYRNRNFDIEVVINVDEKNEWLELQCVEVQE